MTPNSDSDVLLAPIAREGTTVHYRKGQVLFAQGDPSDTVFSIRKGKVTLTVVSKHNKESGDCDFDSRRPGRRGLLGGPAAVRCEQS